MLTNKLQRANAPSFQGTRTSICGHSRHIRSNARAMSHMSNHTNPTTQTQHALRRAKGLQTRARRQFGHQKEYRDNKIKGQRVVKTGSRKQTSSSDKLDDDDDIVSRGAKKNSYSESLLSTEPAVRHSSSYELVLPRKLLKNASIPMTHAHPLRDPTGMQTGYETTQGETRVNTPRGKSGHPSPRPASRQEI